MGRVVNLTKVSNPKEQEEQITKIINQEAVNYLFNKNLFPLIADSNEPHLRKDAYFPYIKYNNKWLQAETNVFNVILTESIIDDKKTFITHLFNQLINLLSSLNYSSHIKTIKRRTNFCTDYVIDHMYHNCKFRIISLYGYYEQALRQYTKKKDEILIVVLFIDDYDEHIENSINAKHNFDSAPDFCIKVINGMNTKNLYLMTNSMKSISCQKEEFIINNEFTLYLDTVYHIFEDKSYISHFSYQDANITNVQIPLLWVPKDELKPLRKLNNYTIYKKVNISIPYEIINHIYDKDDNPVMSVESLFSNTNKVKCIKCSAFITEYLTICDSNDSIRCLKCLNNYLSNSVHDEQFVFLIKVPYTEIDDLHLNGEDTQALNHIYYKIKEDKQFAQAFRERPLLETQDALYFSKNILREMSFKDLYNRDKKIYEIAM